MTRWSIVIENERAGCAIVLAILGFSVSAMGAPAPGQNVAARCDSLYGDLSNMEHCIRNYAVSIEREDIDQYVLIFQDSCEFITVMGTLDIDSIGDIPREPTIRTRGLPEELELMRGMFGAAGEIHFAFEPGEWSRVDSLAGKPCLDCWETCRKTEYSVVFSAETDGEPPASIAGSNRIWMFVSPVRGQWKIFRIIEKEIGDAGD
jgi:hypothetical protein